MATNYEKYFGTPAKAAVSIQSIRATLKHGWTKHNGWTKNNSIEETYCEWLDSYEVDHSKGVSFEGIMLEWLQEEADDTENA